MAKKLHTIQKQYFEINFPTERDSFEFQDKFSRLIKEKLQHVIESVFDTVNTDESIIRVSQIVLDLGEVSYENLESEVANKLEQLLRIELERKIRKIKVSPVPGKDEIISPETSLQETIIFFLETGSLPWWGKKYFAEKRLTIREVVKLLLEKQPDQLLPHLTTALKSGPVKKRLIRELGNDTMWLLFEKAIPEKVSNVQKIKRKVEHILSALIGQKVLSGNADEIFWIFALDIFLSEEKSDIPEDGLLMAFLSHTAAISTLGETEFLLQAYEVIDAESDRRNMIYANQSLRKVLETRIKEIERATGQTLLPKVSSRGEKIEMPNKESKKEEIKQWVDVTNANEFKQFLSRELPAHVNFVIGFINRTVHLLAERGVANVRTTYFIRKIWQAILEHLYIEKKNKAFDKKSFLTSVINNLADRTEITFSVLADTLSPEFEELKQAKTYKKSYTKVEVLRFFLIFGALPKYSPVKDTKEIFQLLSEMSGEQITQLFAGLDRAILPIIAQRVRSQIPSSQVERIFEASPELRMAEIIDQSLSLSVDELLQKLSSQPGLLYSRLKELIEKGYLPATLSEVVQEVRKVIPEPSELFSEVLQTVPEMETIKKFVSAVMEGAQPDTSLEYILQKDDIKEKLRLIFPDDDVNRILVQLKAYEKLQSSLHSLVQTSEFKKNIKTLLLAQSPQLIAALKQGSTTDLPPAIKKLLEDESLGIEKLIREVASDLGIASMDTVRELVFKASLPTIQKVANDSEKSLLVLRFIEKGDEHGVRVLQEKGVVAQLLLLLEDEPERLREALLKGVESERGVWIQHLPEEVLMLLARLIKGDQLGEIVQWAGMYVAREVKGKKYQPNYSEIKQMEWKLIFTTSLSEIKQLVTQQQQDFDKRQEILRQQQVVDEAKKKAIEKTISNEPIYINNAGLVIFAPYLSRYFKLLGLLEEKKFKDDDARQKAVYMVQYLAYKNQEVEEYDLALNKLLCGMNIFDAIGPAPEMSQEEKDLAESLVTGVINNWPSLGKTENDNFRVSFIHREGKLEKNLRGAWELTVEQKGWDVLLDTLPWSIGTVVLPWLDGGITVNWR